MTAPNASNQSDSNHHLSETVANAAERRWAIIVVLIIVSLLAMMVFTGLHWSAMPPSRVETVDVKTLHIKGEFVESNLGTALEKDGRVVVRLIAQQYSFSSAVMPCDPLPPENNGAPSLEKE